MKIGIYILLIGIMISCTSESQSEGKIENTKEEFKQTNHFENISKVEVFGDSLRIEYEVYGDSIIQHRIDLKGTEGDGFDDSYTITSVWSDRISDLESCNSELKIIWDSLDFRFCTKEVIEHYNNLIEQAEPWKGEPTDTLNFFNQEILRLQELKNQIEKKKKKIIQLETMPIYLPFELSEKLQFKAIDLRTNDTISKIIREKYTTEFSGGRNFYLVNQKNDTIGRVHKNDYMK